MCAVAWEAAWVDDGRPFSATSQRLLTLAQSLVPSLEGAETLAIAVGGSAARGDAESGSDLDLLLFVESGDRQETFRIVDDTTVAVMACPPEYPLSLLRGETSLLWVFRELARVRAAIPIYDPHGFLVALQARVARVRLPVSFQLKCLKRARRQTAWAVNRVETEPELALLGLRAALMVALTPALHGPEVPVYRYYSKPKYETSVIAAFPDRERRDLYAMLYDLGTVDTSVVASQREALAVLAVHILESRLGDDEGVAQHVTNRVQEFLVDADNRIQTGDPVAATIPLQYGAFELAWLVAHRRREAYSWVPDAAPALSAIGALDTFFGAVRTSSPPDAAELRTRAVALGALIVRELAALDAITMNVRNRRPIDTNIGEETLQNPVC